MFLNIKNKHGSPQGHILLLIPLSNYCFLPPYNLSHISYMDLKNTSTFKMTCTLTFSLLDGN